jgi:hypothetical protein
MYCFNACTTYCRDIALICYDYGGPYAERSAGFRSFLAGVSTLEYMYGDGGSAFREIKSNRSANAFAGSSD